MSKPIKCGSAPAGTGIDPAAWRVSPLRKPNKGIAAMDSDRRLGVLHRIDSQVGFHSSSSLDRIEQMRCPSCRMNNRQMLCSSCVNTTLRLARIRDVNRELFLRKAEICRRIDDELQAKMKFQSDLHAMSRAIRQLKQKISEKTEMVGRLRRTLALTDVKIAKSSKNVQTLEAASIRHAKVIEEKVQRNQELMTGLETIRDENLRYNRFFTILLAHYFPLKKLELSSRKQKPDDSMMRSALATTTPKVWPPVKKHYFLINGCEINENSQYERLESELVAGSPLVLSKRARLSFAALLYMCQFLNSIAFLLDFNLPYRLSLRELAIWNRWTPDLFSTDIFRLNANVMTLCAAFGLRNEVLVAQSPFNNLHLLIQEMQKSKLSTTRGLLTEQMKQKLETAFKQFSYEERQQDFNLEHVEDDWVSVEMI